MKRCQSCGRLIELLEDFAGLDQESIYCSSCADDDGQIKSFDEVLEILTQRIAKTDGFDVEASRKAAQQILGRQPAWEPKFRKEEGMKTNKRRLTLIAVAVVFALSAAGAAWWVTSRHYEKQDNMYILHLANYDDPFKDLKTTDVKGYKVNELRCKGDQVVKKLDDGKLKFESYDKKWILDSDELSKQKIYSRNNNKKNSENFDDHNILHNNELMFTSSYRINLSDNTHELLVDMPPKIKFGNTERNVTFVGKYPYEYEQKGSIGNWRVEPNSPDSGILFYDNQDIKVVCFPESPLNDFGIDQHLMIFNKKKKIFDLCMKDIAYCALGKSKKYIILELNKCFHSIAYKKIMILDVEKARYELIPAEDCEFQCMSGADKFIYSDEKRKLIEYDFVRKSKHEIGANLPKEYYLMKLINNNGRQTLFLKKEFLFETFYTMDVQTKSIKQINLSNDKQNISFVDVIGNNMIWYSMYEIDSLIEIEYPDDDKRLKKNGGDIVFEGFMKPFIGDLNVTNIFTGKTIKLDDNVDLSGLESDGSYIAWTKYAGSTDDQWENVCWTKIP